MSGVDLVGGNLVSFVLGELRPVVARHHRFRDNAGHSLVAFSNLITYNDLTLSVSNIRSNGDLQSPDAFVATMLGRTTLSKLDGHPGTFIEWVRERDTSEITPEAGLYYFAVDSVDESTRDVRLIMERYRWKEGLVRPGCGSIIYLRHDIPAEFVEAKDPTVELVHQARTLVLRTYTETLELHRTDLDIDLVPGEDWWLEVHERKLLVASTTGGQQDGISVEAGWLTLELEDADGGVLRAGTDWMFTAENTIRLSAWTPRGVPVYAVGVWRRSPEDAPVVHPENLLSVPQTIDTPLVIEQCAYSLARGMYDGEALLRLDDGRIALKHLMDPGDVLTWEVRVRLPQVYVTAKKMAVNPSTIPGLDIAIGDQVEVGDRAALVVFNQRCETYSIYGAKDDVTFDISIKSNDLNTTTELGVLVRNFLLIQGRARLESAGLTVLKVSSSYQGDNKDASGTTSTHTVTLTVTALGDWEYHVPLVTRIDTIEIAENIVMDTLPWNPQAGSRVSAFGINRFLPSYQ